MGKISTHGLNRWQRMSVALLDAACEEGAKTAAVDLIESAQARFDAPYPQYREALRQLVAFGAMYEETFPNVDTPRGIIEFFTFNPTQPVKMRDVWTGCYDPAQKSSSEGITTTNKEQ